VQAFFASPCETAAWRIGRYFLHFRPVLAYYERVDRHFLSLAMQFQAEAVSEKTLEHFTHLRLGERTFALGLRFDIVVVGLRPGRSAGDLLVAHSVRCRDDV